ncbi:Hypothetical predicted protein [Olea europaea subsp. europaea]|uniref:Uncharacterized protein n=1 Tax=Olea europaea subsp. europaea TaxID=158383 RepID=A0A8S0R7D3_OLEEU|nr:Hypothetical predicted protein [Olea europaea subsp. europaea]
MNDEPCGWRARYGKLEGKYVGLLIHWSLCGLGDLIYGDETYIPYAVPNGISFSVLWARRKFTLLLNNLLPLQAWYQLLGLEARNNVMFSLEGFQMTVNSRPGDSVRFCTIKLNWDFKSQV